MRKKKFEDYFLCGVCRCVPTDNTTKLRQPKATKARLNTLAAVSGYTAELLADLLLNDALDQIDSDLPPKDILPNIQVIRKRLGKRIAHSQIESVITWLSHFSHDQLEEALQALKHTVIPPARAGDESRVTKAASGVLCPPPSKLPAQAIPGDPASTTARRGSSTSSLNEDPPHRGARGPKTKSTAGIHQVARRGQAGPK